MSIWISMLAFVCCAPVDALGEPNDPNTPPYFTLVALPDTQRYTQKYPEIFSTQVQWIVDHAESENIVFVTHLGDIVESYGYEPQRNADQWDRADQALSLLEGVCPWGTAIGNHDYDHRDPLDGASQYLAYFGPERFAERPWYGGAEPNGLSSYQVFSWGAQPFLIMHVECDFPVHARVWMETVLARYPTIPTLITTHIYMNASGRTESPFMTRYNAAWTGQSGERVWQDIISRHAQVFLVLCGHISTERTQISINHRGFEVIEMLANYQWEAQGGEGYLRLLRFYPDRQVLDVRTYSPWLDRYRTDGDSQFELPLDLASRTASLRTADLNHDGHNDWLDFARLAENWQRDDPGADLAAPHLQVDYVDLDRLFAHWLTRRPD